MTEDKIDVSKLKEMLSDLKEASRKENWALLQDEERYDLVSGAVTLASIALAALPQTGQLTWNDTMAAEYSHERKCPICGMMIIPNEHLDPDSDEWKDEHAEQRCIEALNKHLANEHHIRTTTET
jgi:hypothetical protein